MLRGQWGEVIKEALKFCFLHNKAEVSSLAITNAENSNFGLKRTPLVFVF